VRFLEWRRAWARIALLGTSSVEFGGGLEKLFGEGEEECGAVVPLGDAGEAPRGLFDFCRREHVEDSAEELKFLAAGFEAGNEAAIDETGDKVFEFEFGRVGPSATVGLSDDGPEFFEGAETLAGRALANGEAIRDFIHGQRLGGAEEDAVDETVGAGIAEEVREFSEDVGEAFAVAETGFGLVSDLRPGDVHKFKVSAP